MYFNDNVYFSGCELYAGLCGLFGLISIVTLTAIAIERCLVISVKPWYGGILFTQAKAKISIIIIWIYCFITMLPPLFGWGAFVPEGFLTSCSFDYITRTYSNRSYFFYIFILGFFLPITIITICYGFIMRTICQNEKDMKKNNVKKVYAKPRKRNDYKAAEMIMLVIAMFLMSWTPYSFIAYIGQFGNIDFISPWVSVLPSLFAKMSTIYNPAIYGLSHRHFRATLRRIFKKEQRSSGERIGTYFSKNSSINRPKAGCPCMPHYGASEVLDESSSFSGKKVYVGVSLANGIDTSRILYVKKPHTPPKQCPCESVCNSEPNSSLFNDVPNVNNDNSAKGTSSSQNGRPAILVMQTDNMSLFRSLMFKSESSIHQKYQTYIQKYHIVRVPSMICSYVNNFQQTGNKAIILHKTEFPLQVPTSYIRVLNMERIPLQTISPNTLQKSENLSRSDQDEAQIS